MTKKQRLFFTATALVVAFAFQGSRGLYETTEGRYAECAREMLQTGQWLVPQLDYHPHWTKPPLTYWAIAGGIKLLGLNTWGVRLYVAVAFVLLIESVRKLAAVMWDSQCGYMAGLSYATSALAVIAANTVNTDVLLSLWELLVVLAYWQGYVQRGKPSEKKWALAMWTFAGLAFLTKGPPGLLTLLVVLVFQLYLRWSGRPRPRLAAVWGVPVLLAVGLWWYVLMTIVHPELWSYFLGDEVIGRIFSGEFNRHPEWYQPFAIYLPLIVFGMGTWIIFWPAIITRYKHLLHWSGFKKTIQADEKAAFLVIWLLLPVLILSLSKSRQYLYILPFFPAVALATARGMMGTYQQKTLRKICVTITVITTGLIVLCKGIYVYVPSERNMGQLYRLCLKQQSGDTAFFLYGHNIPYGLQFYLDGRLKTITSEGKEPNSNEELKNIIAQMRDKPQQDTYVFVLRRLSYGRDFQQALDSAGLSYQLTEQGKNNMFLQSGAQAMAEIFSRLWIAQGHPIKLQNKTKIKGNMIFTVRPDHQTPSGGGKGEKSITMGAD